MSIKCNFLRFMLALKTTNEAFITLTTKTAGAMKSNNKNNKTEKKRILSRRSFLKLLAYSTGGFALSSYVNANFLSLFSFFKPFDVENPLAEYPNRDWERVYREIWDYDYEYTFVCAPNDTHECLLKAHVKNNVVIRIAPTYGYAEGSDLYGNKASARWEPRCCQKGLALMRRFYGDRRVKYPMIREGFLKWVKDGFPRNEDGSVPEKYVKGRGQEPFIKVSWEEAFDIVAKAMENIARTYSGEEGMEKLKKQGYDPLMAERTGGAGTQVLKFRGGMPPLGATRIFAQYRFANMLALLDSHIRGVGPDEAKGARGWDNYSWHTDLPPGHPMVTGQQTVDFDLVCVERADHVVVWGMNWITTKMPDAHWLTEARIKGAKITVITCEYSATANKADQVLIIRPGTDPALALGFAHVIIKEKLYDEKYIKKFTDLPILVRMDNLKYLRPSDIEPNYSPRPLSNYIIVIKDGEKVGPPAEHPAPIVTESMRNEWGDFMVWDLRSNSLKVLTRDDYGERMFQKGIDPALEGTFKVKLADGKEVEVRPVFDLIKQYVLENFDPDTVSEITWAPKEGIIQIARDFAEHAGKTLIAVGMGPNQFFNNDNKDRTMFFLAALTKNIGTVTGNIGSYAGNYRAALFSGLPTYIAEDPFNIQTEAGKPVKVKKYFSAESVHFFNEGEKYQKVGKKKITGDSHIPTPTKMIWVTNSNSLIGNAKWHYDTIFNVLPRVEMVVINEWWWTASCEYSDVIFAVDSWADMKNMDATISVTNPFLMIFPRSPLPRIYNTKGDIECAAGVARHLAKLTGDKRFEDYWKFVNEGKPELYLQRIFDYSNAMKGYDVYELEKKAKRGEPVLVMTRTYPKWIGYEQMIEEKPWYTKTGRLEFFREEDEFRIHGENMPVYREPVDSTFYEPNVIIATMHPAIRPETPSDWGADPNDLSVDMRQVRNVVKPWVEVKKTKHPLNAKDPKYKFIFHTPKFRHGAHTTPVDTDIIAVWFGPFTDIYRRDKRMPYIMEFFVDINPLDAKELGLEDGDYVWIDADPEDRPFRGWQKKKDSLEYKTARLMARIRYYPGTPRGILRMWHNAYAATLGTVEGHEKHPSKLAKNPRTGYQSIFRYGSHQSCTRGLIKPTHTTDSLVRKGLFGQKIGKGFAPDIHCPTGAPRESFVRIELAERSGKESLVAQFIKKGIRPTHESKQMKAYLSGQFVKVAKNTG